jgi:hypothetical protein
VDVIKTALKKSVEQLAGQLTAQLRSNALADGWEPEIAMGLKVEYSNGKFSSSAPTEHATRAFDHEYGTQTLPAKATMRKLNNNSAAAEKQLSILFDKWLRKLS